MKFRPKKVLIAKVILKEKWFQRFKISQRYKAAPIYFYEPQISLEKQKDKKSPIRQDAFWKFIENAIITGGFNKRYAVLKMRQQAFKTGVAVNGLGYFLGLQKSTIDELSRDSRRKHNWSLKRKVKQVSNSSGRYRKALLDKLCLPRIAAFSRNHYKSWSPL